MAEAGEPLSKRELAVLERLVDGSTNKEIAQELSISPNTVKVHLRNIYTKLGVSTRTEAVTTSLQQGIMPERSSSDLPELRPSDVDEQEADSAERNGQEELIGPARYWRIVTVVLVAIIALLLVVVAASSLNGQETQPETDAAATAEESIPEVPIRDTKWLVGRSLTGPRGSMAVAAIGLDLYQIGGEVEAGIVSLVDVFDTSSNAWRPAASKPTAVSEASAAVLFGEIYVPGGRLADGSPTSVVEVYSPANDAWRQITPLPKPLAGALALSDGGRLYLFGGWDGQDYRPDSYVYDPGTDEWLELAPMTTARARATGASLANQLFVVGGFDGEDQLDKCDTYDIAEESWGSCRAMSEGRAGAGAAVLGNKLIYVLGGESSPSAADGAVYDVNDNSWQSVEMPMLEENESWTDLGVTSVETRIFAFGGRQNGELVDSNFIYTPLVHRTFLPAVGDGR